MRSRGLRLATASGATERFIYNVADPRRAVAVTSEHSPPPNRPGRMRKGLNGLVQENPLALASSSFIDLMPGGLPASAVIRSDKCLGMPGGDSRRFIVWSTG